MKEGPRPVPPCGVLGTYLMIIKGYYYYGVYVSYMKDNKAAPIEGWIKFRYWIRKAPTPGSRNRAGHLEAKKTGFSVNESFLREKPVLWLPMGTNDGV